MEPLDCPHCFTTVVPMQDGTCPACRKNTTDPGVRRRLRGQLTISPTSRLPAICCDCGQATQRLVKVRQAMSRDDVPGPVVAALTAFISVLMGLFLFFRRIEQSSRMQVTIPQCHHCASKGAPRPTHVDFASARMTFAVHLRLKEAVSAEQPE